MKTKTTINGYTIRYQVTPGGVCIPNASDILRAVGLESLEPELERFYALLCRVETIDLLKWVCYVRDCNRETARERLKHYFIIDGGLRITRAQTNEIRSEEFQIAIDHISATEERYYFTPLEVQEMLSVEGFKLTKITFKIRYDGRD